MVQDTMNDELHTAQQCLLSIDGLCKQIGKFSLGPVTFAIRPGEVMALVGANGAGKSTLFRLLMALIHPDAGEVRMFGLTYPGQEKEIKQRIGYVPDDLEHFKVMNVMQLADFGTRFYPNWDGRKYAELLQTFQVDKTKRIAKMSTGTQRKAVFSFALACQPDLLLLDEPSAGLDPFAREVILEEIARFMEKGDRAVLMSTHLTEELGKVADRIVLLHEGQLLGCYEKDQLFEQWRVLWVAEVPQIPLPGVVSMEEGEEGIPVRIITSDVHKTAEALASFGLSIIQMQPVELEKVLYALIQQHVQQQTSGPSFTKT